MWWSKLRFRLAVLLPLLISVALWARVALRFVPVPRLLKIASRLGPFAGGDLRSVVAAADLAAALVRGSARCLLRSLLLFGLLGPNMEFVLGVRRCRSSLESHAWVESGGVVVSELPTLTREFDVVFRAGHS